MTGMIGKKLGMTQIYDEQGKCLPVTVIEALPATVVSVRTTSRHGYNAVQAGFGDCRGEKLTKPVLGQFKKAGISPKRRIHEFSWSGEEKPNAGDTMAVSLFADAKKLTVTARSKGKGFAGTVKRYGFSRGPMTHGSHNYRAPGAIGQCASPSRVFPGLKLPGQYGNKRVTVKNLEVVKLDTEKNLIFLRGAVPGPINGEVIIRK